MEAWRKVWREGFAPELSTAALWALHDALANGDARLTQGSTTTPPPMQCVLDWPVEGACPIAFGGWAGDGLKEVGDVEERFAALCFAADQRIGQPAAAGYFINWWDDTPRDQAAPQLDAEVLRELHSRGVYSAPAGYVGLPAAVAAN